MNQRFWRISFPFFMNILDISKNSIKKNNFQICFICNHTDIRILNAFQKTNLIIHKKLWYLTCVFPWIVDYSQTMKCNQSRIFYENVTETWFREIYENAKLWIVLKWSGFMLKMNNLLQFWFYNRNKYNKICRCRHA